LERRYGARSVGNEPSWVNVHVCARLLYGWYANWLCGLYIWLVLLPVTVRRRHRPISPSAALAASVQCPVHARVYLRRGCARAARSRKSRQQRSVALLPPPPVERKDGSRLLTLVVGGSRGPGHVPPPRSKLMEQLHTEIRKITA
jgi:hypothetical protein